MKNFAAKKVAVGVLAAILAAGTAAGGVSQIPYDVLAESIIDSAAKDQKGSLTITKTDHADEPKPLAGAKFTLYKLVSLTPGATAGAFASYTPEADFQEALAGVQPDALGEYNAAQIEALADNLQAAIAEKTIKGTESEATKAEDGTTKVSNLELGYYMVVETTTPNGAVAGKPFFISVPMTNDRGTEWVYDVAATPKNEKLSLEKVVGDNAKSSNTANVGDIISFKVTTSIPTYTEDYFKGDNKPTFIIKDTMDDGLTIQNTEDHPVTVTVGGTPVAADADTYALEAVSYAGAGNTTKPDLKITFSAAFLKTNQGKSVVVDYSALLNEKAASGKTGNGNMAFLTYNNQPAEVDDPGKLVNPTDPDPDDPDNPPDGPNDETETYTFKIIIIEKTDDGNETADGVKDGKPDVIKTGIEYTLLDENGDPVLEDVLTPNENGEIELPCLDGGTYYLKETDTKDGYTLLTNPIKVVITPGVDGVTGEPDGSMKLEIDGTEITKTTPADKDANTDSYINNGTGGDGSAVIIVNKHKGFTLPATGGMGIAIFLTIGLAGIAVISIVLMRKKRIEE